MESKLEIQQALHGYSDGHRKLASSFRLSKDTERQILILSDLSGPGGNDQFDPYITGYPVESGDYYALARTWPAPEMGRPGCVWTHTLLIGLDLLSHLNHPEILLSLFQRPSLEAGFNDYSKALILPSDAASESAPDTMWGGVLIHALYGGTSPYTVLPVKRYSAAEIPFLSVWRLQWPGLRKSFTFCTGVRSQRSLDGEVFHLQGALLRDVRRVDRGTVPLTVIEIPSPNCVHEEWVYTALAAYIGVDNSLMDFFEDVGYRLPGDTTLFRPIVQTYSILNRGRPSTVVNELILYTAKEFPEPDAGRDYKRAFLVENVAGLPEMDLIKGLALTETYASFNVHVLQMRQRAAAFWASEEQAWGLLVWLLTESHNPLGEQAILGLTEAMPTVRLQNALASSPEVLVGIIRREPRFASEESLWRDPSKQSIAAKALLACREELAGQRDEIITAALKAKADPIHPSLFDVFGPVAVESVLNWMNEFPAREIPNGLQIGLSSRSKEMLNWLESHPSAYRETVSSILKMINLDVVANSPILSTALKRFFEEPNFDNVSISVAAKVLQSSFGAATPESVDLAAIAFDVVYHAAAASCLPDDAWYGLLRFLPSSNWWQDWDRCERLRKGIAERFRTEHWPVKGLVGITKDDRVFAEIIDELRQWYSGRRVLAAAAELIDDNSHRALMLSE
ncbi:MAG: hypothetical protein JWM11_1213 [Planctomycetaceae bacterium]|nr:hypothetical protein [Planctomycetaceae bacterium]